MITEILALALNQVEVSHGVAVQRAFTLAVAVRLSEESTDMHPAVALKYMLTCLLLLH
jgi:hypothetical protein